VKPEAYVSSKIIFASIKPIFFQLAMRSVNLPHIIFVCFVYFTNNIIYLHLLLTAEHKLCPAPLWT